MKTTADAAMSHRKKTNPINNCKKLKNENGKRGNNNATMRKPKHNCKNDVFDYEQLV